MASMHRQLSSPGSQGPLPSSAFALHHRDLSPAMTDPTLLSFSERLDELYARLNELQSIVLTRDEYVERRNREDEHIKREFYKLHHTNEKILSNTKSVNESITRISKDFASLQSDVERMDKKMVGVMTNGNVMAGDMTDMRKRMFDLEIGILGLKGKVSQIEDDVSVLRDDVSELKQNVSALKGDVSDMRQNVSDLKQDFSVLRKDFSGLRRLESRFDISDRIRFNSLACGIHAPISIVPRFDENGIPHYPKYFPSTVWRFWCLKKPKRIHRLIELAEFYDIKGFHSWHYSQACNLDSDASESEEDQPIFPTVAEAARRYPEACHRALAATLGLNYRKIEKEIERSEEFKQATKRSAESTSTPARKKVLRPAPPSRVEDPQIPRYSPPRRRSPRSVTTSQEGYVEWRQDFNPHSEPVITDDVSFHLVREGRAPMEREHREREERGSEEQRNNEELEERPAGQADPRIPEYSLSNPYQTVPTVPFSRDDSTSCSIERPEDHRS